MNHTTDPDVLLDILKNSSHWHLVFDNEYGECDDDECVGVTELTDEEIDADLEQRTLTLPSDDDLDFIIVRGKPRWKHANWNVRVEDGYRMAQSATEHMLWHMLSKCDEHQLVSATPQVPCGRYRFDCVLITKSRSVCVECDSKRWHKHDDDVRRDIDVLSHGVVDEVWRIPYAAMQHYPYGTLSALSEWDRNIVFSKPGFVMSRDELIRQLCTLYAEWVQGSNLCPATYLDNTAEHSWDIVEVKPDQALVSSPKAFLFNWKISPIIRRTKQWAVNTANAGKCIA